MVTRKKGPENYLIEKRNEILWSMGQQDYSLAQLSWIFGISKTAVHNIIKETPKNWKSPYIKVTSPQYQKQINSEKNRIKSTYTSWVALRKRCRDPKTPQYKDYGGRGISICERWNNSFPNFLQDMGVKPNIKLSIDRINNDGNYEPTNCRWATSKEQAGNTRCSIKNKAK